MGDDALAADRRLASWFEQVGREIPGWLVEHLQNGFPESADITDAATPYGRTWILGNESMSAHQRLVIAEHRPLPAVVLRLACRPLERMLASRRSRARTAAGSILRQVRGLDRAPTYRGIVVVDRSAVG
jgi:hypothetical protein